MTLKKKHLSVCIVLVISLLLSCIPFDFSYGVMKQVGNPSYVTSFSSSNNFTDENIKCTVKGRKMTIAFKTLLPTYQFRLGLYGVYPPTDYTPLDIFVLADSSQIGTSGIQIYQFTYTINFKDYNIDDGLYYLYLSRIESPEDSYESYPSNGALYKNMPFQLTKNTPKILQYNDVIAENKRVQAIGDDYDPSWYLDTSLDDMRFVLRNPATGIFASMNDYKVNFIRSLSYQITGNATSDYDKLLKMYEYVANNFYYDSIAFSTHSFQYADPYDNLYNNVNKIQSPNSDDQGRVATTCQGFSAMLIAMARCQNIPSRLVYGHRLTPPKNTWDTENNIGVRDHWWLEAYVDGRWIIIDPTVGTNNRWNKNTNTWKYYGITNYTYFDPSNEQFAVSHIYHNIYPDKRFGYLISNASEIDRLTGFFETYSGDIKNGKLLNDDYNMYDKKTWGDGRKSHFMTDGYGNTTQIQWSNKGFTGTLDLNGFAKLKLLSSHHNKFESVNLSNCPSLENVYLRYNPLKTATIAVAGRNVNLSAKENGTFSLALNKNSGRQLTIYSNPDIGYKVKGIYSEYSGRNLSTKATYRFTPGSSSFYLEFELNPEGYRYYLYSYNNTSKTKPYNLAVQKRLSQLGYFSGSIDGNYAEDTEDAIETFQRVHGQPITGNVGKNTWRELFNPSAISKPTDEIISQITEIDDIKLYAEAVSLKGKIKISWLDPSIDLSDENGDILSTTPIYVDGYQVYKYDSIKGRYIKMKTTKNLSYTNTFGLVNGKTYNYKIRAYKNINGRTYYSQWTKVSAKANVPKQK